ARRDARHGRRPAEHHLPARADGGRYRDRPLAPPGDARARHPLRARHVSGRHGRGRGALRVHRRAHRPHDAQGDAVSEGHSGARPAPPRDAGAGGGLTAMTAFEPLNPDFAARVRDSFARQPMMAHLGATLAAVEPGYCEIHLPWRRELTQQHGYIHGGALAAIIDSAAGYAAFSLMPADASVLTVEYKLNLL